MTTRKLNIKLVKERLSVINKTVTILSDQYVNAKTKMDCLCNGCGQEWSITWDSLSRGRGCPYCAGNIKLTIEKINDFVVKNSNSKLLTEHYDNSGELLLFRCECGNEYRRNFYDFKKSSKDCSTCGYKRAGEVKRMPDEEIKRQVESLGLTLDEIYRPKLSNRVLVRDDEDYRFSVDFQSLMEHGIGSRFGKRNEFYKSNIKMYFKNNVPDYTLNEVITNKKDAHVNVTCKEGHTYSTGFYTINSGGRCWECHLAYNQGVNHPRYNPLVTDEERMARRYQLNKRSQKLWARNVHKKHGYKCVICESNRELEAHHLEAWNIAKHKRFNVENGVTLCRRHHTVFHQTYGYGNNTKEQFDEYLESTNKDLQLN